MQGEERYEFAWARLGRIVTRISGQQHIDDFDLRAIVNIEAKANPLDEDREDLLTGEEPPEHRD
jgi:hypothetical protein